MAVLSSSSSVTAPVRSPPKVAAAFVPVTVTTTSSLALAPASSVTVSSKVRVASSAMSFGAVKLAEALSASVNVTSLPDSPLLRAQA